MEEIQKVKGYEFIEIKSPSGDLQEIKFKVHSVLGVDNYTKNIVLGVIVVVGIIFCFIQGLVLEIEMYKHIIVSRRW